MKITLKEMTIREIVSGYTDNDEEGVTGYDGKLNIRPKYQREFVYDETKRKAVIETVYKKFPLNVMYWVVNEAGTFEVLDGQQRTVSICQYVENVFSVVFDRNPMFFHNLPSVDREKILDYRCMVYFCEGNDQEKLDWFETINIAGERLTPQELRNAVYTGPWLTSAKSMFSKSGCVAYSISKDYVAGVANRQELLETAIKWIYPDDIAKYMAIHQEDPNADALWDHFEAVINWVKTTFPTYRREMKGIDWGSLYSEYKTKLYDATELEKKISTLMEDEEVTKPKGIYNYVLSGEEKTLNLRAFTPIQKRQAYERQKKMCFGWKRKAHGPFTIDEMQADHIRPWSKGGKTNSDNCQMLCADCNRQKSAA